MQNPLKLALFDCDGTLVDSQASIIKAMDLMCETFEKTKLSRESIKHIVGLPLERGMEILFPGNTLNTYDEMADTYRAHFRKMRLADEVEEPIFEGTEKALSILEAEGWLLGVATGKAMRGLIPTLQTHGLEPYFTTLQTACRARGKPDPEMVEKALSETGVDAKNCVMIGDTTYDILMACNANVKSIGVSWGYHSVQDLKDAGAHAIVHSYEELPAMISKVMEMQ